MVTVTRVGMVALLVLAACGAEPAASRTQALGCNDEECATSADCSCDDYACTGRGACVATAECSGLGCTSDADCCQGQHCRLAEQRQAAPPRSPPPASATVDPAVYSTCLWCNALNFSYCCSHNGPCCAQVKVCR